MRSVVVLALILFSSVSFAGEVRPYFEYKLENKFANSDHVLNVSHYRFGATYKNFYLEMGPASSTKLGGGKSGEFGYKFRLHPRLFLKGKWEGSSYNDLLGHKFETEIRWYFD
jgi:hypothetical protein